MASFDQRARFSRAQQPLGSRTNAEFHFRLPHNGPEPLPAPPSAGRLRLILLAGLAGVTAAGAAVWQWLVNLPVWAYFP